MASSYFSGPNEGFPARKWLFGALAVSLLLHGVMAIVFHRQRLQQFQAGETTERLVPRPFSAKPVKIDPKVFEEAPPEKVVLPTSRRQLPNLPAEKPLAQELPDKVTLTPTELATPILKEKPGTVEGDLAKIAQPRANAAVEQELAALHQQLVGESTSRLAPSSPIKLPPIATGNPGDGTGSPGRETPGFSNLNDLLAQAGPLSGEVAPVNMPGGALFEYDRAELLPEAMETMRKLAELIRRNPRATFSIEGHSDSYGDADYNLALSRARAEAVKAWLVNDMGVDPARIETRGFGSTRLIAPAEGTPDEQQINRRVEIVIRTPKE